MKQTDLGLNLTTKRTRKGEFLAPMEGVVPWAALVNHIAPYYGEGKNGRPPFALETRLQVHFMQQWFSLSDPAMEEAFFDTPLYREFARLDTHMADCLTKAPSSDVVTGWRNTNWPNRYCWWSMNC